MRHVKRLHKIVQDGGLALRYTQSCPQQTTNRIMSQQEAIAFFIFAIVAAVTPGPSNVLVMAAGARAGFRGGLPCLAGVVIGMAALMSAATLGLGGFVKAYPASLAILKWGGSIFLLWLAWKVASAPAIGSSSGAAAPPEAVGFRAALAFQWVNPKSWVVSVSAAGAYAGGGEFGVLERALMLGGLFALAAAPSCAAWLAFGASMQRWLTNERRSRVFNMGMGLALVGSVWFLLH
jgi:threonine/homoserine/homoserine lactone efflux protein